MSAQLLAGEAVAQKGLYERPAAGRRDASREGLV